MQFLAYPKISTSKPPSQKHKSADTWLAQEKVHGAQLVIGVRDGIVRFGKRKSWLEEHDSFFGFQLIRADLKALALRLAEELQVSPRTSLYLYGELFGGGYPHEKVQVVPAIQPVQTGVWYSPTYHWMLFDAIRLPSSDVSQAHFLSPSRLLKALHVSGGIIPPVLGKGRVSELLSLPIRFQTTVPVQLGLPEIKHNFAEGLVLKPDAEVPVGDRDVMKIKIPEFDEIQFNESEAWNSHRYISLNELEYWAKKMVNAPRMASARSKVGAHLPHLILEEVVLDILVDLTSAFPASMKSLSPEHETHLKDLILDLARAISKK